jgi:transcriptional repressor NrdR
VLCPFCAFESTRVVDSRLTDPGDAIRRRRECAECGERFTTYERVEAPPVLVVKRDGHRERFDRQKLLRGLVRAANKRPVSEEQLDELADSIASEVRRGGAEIKAEDVGELCLRGLARLDPVTAIQFASVYRAFSSLDELEGEVRRIRDAIPSAPHETVGGPPQRGPRDSTDPRRPHARQP